MTTSFATEIAFVTTRFEPTHSFVMNDARFSIHNHGLSGVYTFLPEPFGGARVARHHGVHIVCDRTSSGVRPKPRPLDGLRAIRTVLAIHREDHASIPARTRSVLRSMALLPRALWHAADMRRRGIEHVHACWANDSAILARVCASLIGGTFSVSAHAYDLLDDRAPTLRRRVAGATVLIACSERAAARAKRQISTSETPLPAPPRVVVVRHGVDLSRFPFVGGRAPPEPPRITFLGRLVRKKGIPTLISAVHRLAASTPNVLVVIAGPSTDRRHARELRRLARRGPAASRIRFVGPRDALTELPLASVVVHPGAVDPENGDEDGVPNVLLEAMALGVPVVAGNVGGIPEIVRHEETGLLVPPDDAPALARSLANVLTNAHAAHTRARRAREMIERDYDAARNAARLVSTLVASRERS